MPSKQATSSFRMFALLAVLVFTIAAVAPPFAMGQATVGTGVISGTVTDPTGAVVPGAKVTISSKQTAQSVMVTTNQTGAFSSGPLLAGDYVVRIEKAGFSTVEIAATVQVGTTSTTNAKLAVGRENEVINVEASGIQVNTEQPSVQGVLTTQQIEQLPINGRNFLDLAQLEPGVQIQDGGNFDPTKNGFMSISFSGRFGRTARIEVDGIDISDETVGTTTQNIPQSAIQEFQVAQSSLDVSTELTSSGTVNVVTRTGTNSIHGEGFYDFRDSSVGAHLPGTIEAPYQRNFVGGRLGGPIVKDKLFFFFAGEHVLNHLAAPQVSSGPFAATLSGTTQAPFYEGDILGRLDWQIKPDNYRLFYRFTYDQNGDTLAFVTPSFQPFTNKDNTPAHAVGFDFTKGNLTNSIRFAYMKFRNGIVDASQNLGGAFNPAPSVDLSVGPDFFCIFGGDAFCSGTPFLAPQKTFQTNKQFKYDGSWLHHNHTIRFGGGINRILGGGFAGFLANGPAVNSNLTATEIAFAAAGPLPGGSANPLNYPANNVFVGNGQGFSSELPEFGFPGSGQRAWRGALYIADVWKARPNLTVTGGVRWSVDTGRTDSDVPGIPCSASPAPPPNCTGLLLDSLQPGLGKAVRQPWTNFGPQIGFSWDPWSNGKTVIRGGIGLYFENVIFNNVLFDRPARLQNGVFLSIGAACFGGTASPVIIPGSPSITPDFCGLPMGAVDTNPGPFNGMFVWQAAAALEDMVRVASASVGSGPNPSFIGTTLCNSANCTGDNTFLPAYRTPRSVQMNIGVQREIKRGWVLQADYVRNVSTHYLLSVDPNHVGAARFLDATAAANAIANTNNAFGCGLDSDQASTNCAIAAGATIFDYAGNGLDSGESTCFGFPCPGFAAFPGQNPNWGSVQMLSPIGRSVYNGLLMSLRGNANNPFRGVKHLNVDISYALSKFDGMATDQDFINFAFDQDNPHLFHGPNGLDRKHQVSFGIVADTIGGFRTSFIGHFYSPLPQNMLVPTLGSADIFINDFTGDGTTGDPLPGTNLGAFGRNVTPGNINTVIGNYNTQFAGCNGSNPPCAGQPTPAGSALIGTQNPLVPGESLMTLQELQQLGGVMQPIPLAPAGQVNMDWMRVFDFELSRPIKVGEHVVVEPSVGIFNVLNFANFSAPGGLELNGTLTGSCGSINGTVYAPTGPAGVCPLGRTDRVGVGSGLFNLGAPRTWEFGLRISF